MIDIAFEDMDDGILIDIFIPKAGTIKGSFFLGVDQIKLITQFADIFKVSIQIDLRVLFIEGFDMLRHMGHFVIVIRF
ncbi:hypothetical protein D3C81_1387300 [compost metagenome]